MSFIKTFALAIAAGLSLAAAANAAEHGKLIEAAAAESIDLGGGAKALTYWVDGADGRHVVTTVDSVIPDGVGTDTGRHIIVRFSSTLQPGQTQMVSVPGRVGTDPRELQIRSTGNKVEITHTTSLEDSPQNMMSTN